MQSMRIHSVDVILLAVALDVSAVRNAVIATGSQAKKEALLCRVRLEDGIVGECYVTLLGATGVDVAQVAAGVLAPRLQGMDGGRPVVCWQAMMGYARKSFWNRPIALRAMACIDGALWDAAGKAAGMPLHRLWGGAREQLPVVMMDSRWHAREPVQSLCDRLVSLREMGFAGCKLKVGVHSPFGPEADAQRLCQARESVGPGFQLFADANQGWALPEALAFMRGAQQAGLAWLEEPCHWPDDKRGMARLRATSLVPICAGQMESTGAGCQDLIDAASIDICNADASFCGVGVWREIAALAAASSIDMVHHMEPQLGAALSASVARGRHLEVYDEPADPFWYRMVVNRPHPAGGVISLPQTPGWGWTLDQDFIDAHCVAAGGKV
jgi:L-alanine-DL-glutamate epimerase-like enolase superfamily enzyme